MVDTPKAVNHIPITGQAAKKKCRLLELLKLPYWNMRRPKYPCAAEMLYVSSSWPKMYPALRESELTVSERRDEVTSEPCISTISKYK